MRRIRGQVTTSVVAAIAAALLGAAAAPAADLETILQDDAQLLHRPEDQLRRSLEELRLLGVDRIRVTAGWSVLTRGADSTEKPQFDAADPAAYEQERWRNLDRLLVLAREYGLQAMVDVGFWAPHWAASDPVGERGRTGIDAVEYARFATAVARRYSGSFIIPRTVGAPRHEPSDDERVLTRGYGTRNRESGTTSLHESLGLSLRGLSDGDESSVDAALGTEWSPPTAPLPKVDVLSLWNEPNHTSFMRPQWVRHRGRYVPRSPHVYRALVQQAYPAIKSVRPDATVLAGGTSFNGSYSGRGTGSVPPLRFLREFACVNRRFERLERSGCRRVHTVPVDGWTHHPYTMQTHPDQRSPRGRRDDIPIADLPRMARTLDRLVREGRLTAGARNIWVTEYGYETNPPVKGWIWSWGDQAYFLTWAEYLAWKVPTVRSFAQFLLRDLPPGAFRVGDSERRPFGQWQSGLLEDDGDPKLAAHSFRAGLFVQRTARGRLRLWGRMRLGGGPWTVAIDKRDPRTKGWSTLPTVAPGGGAAGPSFSASGSDPFMRFARAPGGSRWRYRLRYLDGDRWVTMPLVPSVGRR